VWKHDPAIPFAKEARPPAEDASAERLLDLMKANGVSRTVIIQVIHYRGITAILPMCCSGTHNNSRCFCRVNPEDPAAPDHLSKLTEEQGFRGVRLSPSGNADGDWIHGPLMPPLWQRCAQLKVPMTVLTPSRDYEYDLIERNPELTGEIDHMATRL